MTEQTPNTEKLSIENLQLVADFAVELASKLNKDLQDSKVTLLEAVGYIGTLIQLPTIIQAIKFVPAEIKDLDPEEQSLLVNHIAYRLKTEKLAVATEFASHTLNLLYSAHLLSKIFKSLK
jgi:hypothetical protein